MLYHDVQKARFLSRPNRFIAHVELNGHTEVCHVKNTGRCRELLTPGAAVYLQPSANPARKTNFDLIAVEKNSLLINMDAQAPNQVFGEWVRNRLFLPELLSVKPEYTWEDSRFDFLLEDGRGKYFVEVKGVTLEENGRCLFPDAPTQRGVKHLNGLLRAAQMGIRSAVFFVIQMKGPSAFLPNDATHPEFGQTLRNAAKGGVGVFAYDCCVSPDSLCIDKPVPVIL